MADSVFLHYWVYYYIIPTYLEPPTQELPALDTLEPPEWMREKKGMHRTGFGM